jgi:hypothetical protein
VAEKTAAGPAGEDSDAARTWLARVRVAADGPAAASAAEAKAEATEAAATTDVAAAAAATGMARVLGAALGVAGSEEAGGAGGWLLDGFPQDAAQVRWPGPARRDVRRPGAVAGRPAEWALACGYPARSRVCRSASQWCVG